MQIKITMSYHLTPIGMVVKKEARNTMCWQWCRKKGTLMYCWWKCRGCSYYDNSMEFLKKLWSTDSTSEYLSKENENTNSKRYLHTLFTATLFIMAKMCKQPEFTNGWLAKENMVCPYTYICIHVCTCYFYIYIIKLVWMSFHISWMSLHIYVNNIPCYLNIYTYVHITECYIYVNNMECYSAIKKMKILLFVSTWMSLEGIILSEMSQTKNDKYLMISFICGI